ATCTEDLLIQQVVDNAKDHAEQQFNIFKSKFNKSYATKEEHDYRFTVFKADLEFMEERNKINKAAGRNYTLGIQEFSDLTFEEFSAGYLGLRVDDDSWMPSAEETLLIVSVLSIFVVILLITRFRAGTTPYEA
ncbi:cysteine proteinase RD19a-like, partial [Trifolium medium]|nr:cysteine proteinase RD19a-like [Trifolium medium]